MPSSCSPCSSSCRKGEIAAGRLRGVAVRAELAKTAAACRAKLVESRADLDGDTSVAIADDLEDLRKLLGYERWNLYGLSYGTRDAHRGASILRACAV